MSEDLCKNCLSRSHTPHQGTNNFCGPMSVDYNPDGPTLECRLFIPNPIKNFRHNAEHDGKVLSAPKNETQDAGPGTRDWSKEAKLMDEIQVRLNEAWYLFCRLKGMIVPDPPGLKDPKVGDDDAP